MKTIQDKKFIHRIYDDVFIINKVLDTSYKKIFKIQNLQKYRIILLQFSVHSNCDGVSLSKSSALCGRFQALN